MYPTTLIYAIVSILTNNLSTSLPNYSIPTTVNNFFVPLSNYRGSAGACGGCGGNLEEARTASTDSQGESELRFLAIRYVTMYV